MADSRCYVCNALPQDGCQAIGGEVAECPRPARQTVPDDQPEEDDGDLCAGCNPEPTISELENGRCDCCGKELP